ncbi:MAG: tetratricopeptide repeat protein [Opitutae bacterium]|nr:tetratricopeptide repeat protein [Opitutae bacterium]
MKKVFRDAPDDGSDPFRGAGGPEASPDDPSIPPHLRKSAASAPPTPMSAPKPEAPPAPKPGPAPWMRPQPVRRDSNVRAWLLFLAGIVAVAGLWVPVRSAYQQYRYKPAAAGIRDADSFIALAYAGVSGGKTQGSDEVSRAQFEQHVRILRERGFHPIGLADVQAFYQEGRPLPRKAVLLTLEQGKKNSHLETRQILQANRWKAVMFVRADTIRAGDPDALRWPILRDMVRSGTWEAGAESVAGFRRIPAGPNGETANFFASPEWIDAEQRLETPEEFLARVRRDHAEMVAEFQKGMGANPIAFAFPFGDYGQFDPRAVPTRVANLVEVGKTYGLGFAAGPFLLNTRHSDPRALNRLRVNPEWSPEQFAARVESGWATAPWKMERPLDAARWLTDWGVTEYPAEGGMVLKALGPQPPGAKYAPTTGALAWLMASDLFGDFALRIQFRVMAGQFGLRLRSRAGGEESVRLLFDAEGNVWVNQKVFGAEEFTQAVARDLAAFPGKKQDLEIHLQGRNLFVQLNGRMLLKEPLDLLGDGPPGLFGMEVWDPEIGAAETRIVALEFPRPRHVLKQWPSGDVFSPTRLMDALGRDAFRLAAVSPPWLDAVGAVPLILPRWDDASVRVFARMRGADILPRLTLGSAALAQQIPPGLPAQEAAAMDVDGIHLDCRLVPVEEISALVPWLQQIDQHVKERNMKLAIQFPESLTKLASFASIAALFPGALVAVDSAARAEELEPALPNVLTAEQLPSPAADLHLSLYYQLATRDLPLDELSPQARQEAYRREGYLAYQEGRFDQAIEPWRLWLAEDPRSAEAMSLIGRAHLQKNDLEAALDFYTRSLQASPGQIHMAIRRAELLEKMGRDDESREQLNLYARVFPENPDILIAQAQWLDRHKRRAEARAMVETLVAESPLNLDARLALLELQDQPAERYQTMRGILELGQSRDSQIPFGHSLMSMEMLTYPESAVFFDHLRKQAARGQATKQRELYEGFLPLAQPVADDFAAGKLSDGWVASGGMRALERGRYELRAAIDQAETYLRLRRSELVRDGALEVMLDESQGFFWLYARRSSRAMVRFGFDQDGFIHLQAWNRGELLASDVRPWIRPPGSLKMRLEIRGDGARGFVNGLEIFDGPVAIPEAVAYGWWGIAPFAFDLGVARARILKMDFEPWPATLVLLPPGDPVEQAKRLRPFVGGMSALVPAWVFQQPDGTLPAGLPAAADVLRMFGAFHRVRLLPALDLSYDGDVEPTQIVDFIQRNGLAGAVVKRRTPAPAAWLERLAAALEERPADVIVLQTEAALWNSPRAGAGSKGEYVVRPEVGDRLLPEPGEDLALVELPVGSVLIPPLRGLWNVPLRTPGEPPRKKEKDPSAPRLYLMGADGGLALPPPP